MISYLSLRSPDTRLYAVAEDLYDVRVYAVFPRKFEVDYENNTLRVWVDKDEDPFNASELFSDWASAETHALDLINNRIRNAERAKCTLEWQKRRGNE